MKSSKLCLLLIVFLTLAHQIHLIAAEITKDELEWNMKEGTSTTYEYLSYQSFGQEVSHDSYVKNEKGDYVNLTIKKGTKFKVILTQLYDNGSYLAKSIYNTNITMPEHMYYTGNILSRLWVIRTSVDTTVLRESFNNGYGFEVQIENDLVILDMDHDPSELVFQEKLTWNRKTGILISYLHKVCNESHVEHESEFKMITSAQITPFPIQSISLSFIVILTIKKIHLMRKSRRGR